MLDETKAFHHAVYSAVCQVPSGSVTSYGHIAYLIGRPQNARQVGASLKNSAVILKMFEAEGVTFPELPWWRVVSSSGQIAKREVGEVEQKHRLLAENVQVQGMAVVMDDFGWFPDDIEYT